ncbi:Protein of unknown function [Ekhidna lutea]|uniref:DUF2911 domain-containing protein n=1 Tax=Ekhidna lutea TaxID=447679 RepID=A0A239K644_EKHLU|nr:DUF2911 domain-containing protein [Ekhidna lutea]SNT13089.1 Protein of unknown function [Ekhidna lutea]
MKRITNLIALCVLVTFGATAQISTPAPSPAGSVSSTVGLTDINIDYFRPGVKDRQIFGTGDEYLEQYGEVWRTGANAGTMISFSTDVKVAGQDVKAGEYQIVSIPGESEWQIMLLSEPIGGNESAYNDSLAVVKTKVKSSKTAAPVERMTFQISDISADNTSANIHFAWANASWKVPIEVSFHESVMKDIAAKTQVNPQNYVAAANYYLNSGENLEQALEWMNKYLSIGENSGQFWHVHTKAQILAKLGKKKEAIATAQDSMAKAKAFEQGDFGYIKRNEDLIASLK